MASRSVRPLSAGQLDQLTWRRLDAYRSRLPSLQQSAVLSDLDDGELARLETHDLVVALLARAPAPSIPATAGPTDRGRRSHGGRAPTRRRPRGSAGSPQGARLRPRAAER